MFPDCGHLPRLRRRGHRGQPRGRAVQSRGSGRGSASSSRTPTRRCSRRPCATRSPSVRCNMGLDRDEVDGTGRRHARDARHRRPRRPRAVPALGRPEEAGRDRVGARDEPRGAAVRRADRRARPAHAAVADRAHRRAERAPGKTIVLATHDLDALELLADRCVVFSEDHRIVAAGSPAEMLGDRDLLLSVNLIHEHSHHHGDDDPHPPPRRQPSPGLTKGPPPRPQGGQKRE